MPRRISVLAALHAGLIVIAGALGAWGTLRFTPAINDPRPPLAHTAPYLEPAPGPPLARKVLVVLVDGLRRDASYDQPALDSLRARGTDVPARAPFPTISKANYVTTGSGVPPRFSGARTNDGFVPHAIDSIFARVVAATRTSAYVADRTRGLARLFAVADRTVAPLGDALTLAVTRALERADLVLWKLMEVDMAGHSHGASSDAYRTAVRTIDTQLAATIATFDFARDTIIVVADHGQTDRGGHGGHGDDVERIPFILAGAGVRAGTTLSGEANLVDLAPTVAALLGVPAPGHALGRTLVDALVLTPADRDALLAADARRHAHLAPILARIEADDAAAYRRSLLLRVPLALLAIAALVFLARRARIDRRALLTALVFPVAYYAYVFGVDRVFELPSVPASRVSIWGLTWRAGAIAAALHVVATILARRQAFAPLIASGPVATATPALLAWAFAGPALATMLPGTELMLLAPAAFASLAYYAGAALLGSIARQVTAA